MERVAVVGSGLMGSHIAMIFAVRGHPVRLMDTEPGKLEAARQAVTASLDLMRGHGVDIPEGNEAILGRIEDTTDLNRACDGAAFVFEAVFEDMALKQDLFARMDALCPPQTILCSNTSAMSITEIASKAQHRERIVGTHFWNPPHLIPLVEVVKARDTSDGVVDATYALLARVGKQPVKVLKDVPGFVGNRLQHALWREAFAIIEEGICDAETVDTVVKSGPGLRWPILGPVENADLVGLDLTKAIHDYLLPHLSASPRTSPLVEEHIKRGELGFKSGAGLRRWTDAQIRETRERLATHLLRAQAERVSVTPAREEETT